MNKELLPKTFFLQTRKNPSAPFFLFFPVFVVDLTSGPRLEMKSIQRVFTDNNTENILPLSTCQWIDGKTLAFVEKDQLKMFKPFEQLSFFTSPNDPENKSWTWTDSWPVQVFDPEQGSNDEKPLIVAKTSRGRVGSKLVRNNLELVKVSDLSTSELLVRYDLKNHILDMKRSKSLLITRTRRLTDDGGEYPASRVRTTYYRGREWNIFYIMNVQKPQESPKALSLAEPLCQYKTDWFVNTTTLAVSTPSTAGQIVRLITNFWLPDDQQVQLRIPMTGGILSLHAERILFKASPLVLSVTHIGSPRQDFRPNMEPRVTADNIVYEREKLQEPEKTNSSEESTSQKKKSKARKFRPFKL